MKNCKVGPRNCRMPSVVRRMDFAAWLKSSKGNAVATPVPTTKAARHQLPPNTSGTLPRVANQPKANGASNAVSAVSPARGVVGACFRTTA